MAGEGLVNGILTYLCFSWFLFVVPLRYLAATYRLRHWIAAVAPPLDRRIRGIYL